MTHPAPPAVRTPAASAAHPGRSPPSPRTSLRLTGAPPSTARRACVSSPKQTATQSVSYRTRSSLACWSRSPLPAAAPTQSTSPAPPPQWTAPLARSSTTTTPATSPANASSSAAVTAAQPSARPAPASTPETPTTSSRRPPGRQERPRLRPPPAPTVRHSTAPSFGSVHRPSELCRPRRDGGTCEHGRPLGCGLVHAPDEPSVGQPLCPDCYDYTAHVLWHAYASKLWDRFVIDVRRRLASSVGLVQSRFPRHARLSFARVAEYQKRVAVHVHAVVRLDGPTGPDDEPPAWATAELLIDAVRASARRVLVRTPYSPAVGELNLRWGAQTDARPLQTDGEGPDDDAVAAYVAKYVTKGASDTGAGTDYPLSTSADIESASVSEHTRTLMRTCWRLGGLPEYAPPACVPGLTRSATGDTSSPNPAPTPPPTQHFAPNAPTTRATPTYPTQSPNGVGATSALATRPAPPSSRPALPKISPSLDGSAWKGGKRASGADDRSDRT